MIIRRTNHILDALSTEYTHQASTPLDLSPYVFNALGQSRIVMIIWESSMSRKENEGAQEQVFL